MKIIERMMMKIVISELHKKHDLKLDTKRRKINGLLVKEYMNEYHGRVAKDIDDDSRMKDKRKPNRRPKKCLC